MKIGSLIFTTLLTGFGEDFNTIIKTFGEKKFANPSFIVLHPSVTLRLYTLEKNDLVYSREANLLSL